MKVLCTCMPSHGHFHPMVPLARELVAAGHVVRFATAPAFHGEVRSAGFEAVAAGIDPGETRERTRMSTVIWPEAALPDLLAEIDTWRPDLVLHEEGEHAGPLAAAVARIPAVTVGWPAPLASAERAARLRGALAPLWEAHGQGEPAPVGLYLDGCPPALQSPRIAELPGARPMRPVAFDAAEHAELPAWLTSGAAAPHLRGPVVYLTFGTVAAFNRLPGLDVVLDALRGEALELVVTVGQDNDLDALARRFPHVRMARYIPQSHLLPRCELVICHGGASTATAALAHGLPLLVLPRGAASQQRIAEACAVSGAGRMLDGAELTQAAILGAVRELRAEARYRLRARSVAAQIAAMPSPAAVVPWLEREARSGGRVTARAEG